jgi:Ca2+-binding EF-hand superfamily protein
MRSTTTSILTSALLAVGAAPAGADSAEDSARAAFAETDRNGDGQVDRDEFYSRMVEMFYRADANKDGVLVPSELQTIDEDRVFEPADRNGDGKLTLNEYIDQRFESFDEADVNSDGVLSVQEVIDAYDGA